MHGAVKGAVGRPGLGTREGRGKGAIGRRLEIAEIRAAEQHAHEEARTGRQHPGCKEDEGGIFGEGPSNKARAEKISSGAREVRCFLCSRTSRAGPKCP